MTQIAIDPAVLADMDFETIRTMQNQLAQAAQAKQAAARKEALTTIRHLVSLHGFTVDDLKGIGSKASKPGKSGGVIPPKYRNPETGETWGGRGASPKWLRDVPKGAWGPYLIENQGGSTSPLDGDTFTVNPELEQAGVAPSAVLEEEPTPQQLGEDTDDTPTSPLLFSTVIGGEDDDGSDPVADKLTSPLFANA